MYSGGGTFLRYKVVLLGDQSVGKTSIITRFINGTFEESYHATIGIDFFSKTLLLDGVTVRLHVWDTAGQERFRALIPGYIRDSAATLVVYDVASRLSFLNTFKWVDDVRALRGNETIIVLVGNKSDEHERREVTAEEAQEKADEYGIMFTEVSAMLGTGVGALFKKVAETLVLAEGTVSNKTVEVRVDPPVPLMEEPEEPFLSGAPRVRYASKPSGNARVGCC
ncbi:ADP ribosylation factor family Ras of Complex Roc domain [Trypanosoma vivax]|uniref:Putative small GTP-binding protein RAB6 n=1 Tax=Trypanosoma vivax (strain Y486) TaxID=1055687 RepID=G0TRN4_TRYVY|nr:putative small GTP-binding protein RAB6 [Trypanosoma vivax]KAH8607991.1 ADP ribosylation factor family Ras of Complex Roc domain [Trypanosoma vivax]CCC46604.1 putative small GTP-binding protein RAB6 [Trypanosoma vivax Y486]